MTGLWLIRRVQDILLALLFLTRLPVSRLLSSRLFPDRSENSSALCVWAFPLVGVLIGSIGAFVCLFFWWLGLPVFMTAVFCLLFLTLLTGGLHEDGLADFADGLAGHDPAHRLAIMRDSRIGSYGVLALVLALALRGGAIAEIIDQNMPDQDLLDVVSLFAAFITICVISRGAMLLPLILMKPARPDGLGKFYAQASPKNRFFLLAAGLLITLAILILVFITDGKIYWLDGAIFLAASVGIGCLPAFVAHSRIGGQTGDILGAVQQFTEIAAWSLLILLTI